MKKVVVFIFVSILMCFLPSLPVQADNFSEAQANPSLVTDVADKSLTSDPIAAPDAQNTQTPLAPDKELLPQQDAEQQPYQVSAEWSRILQDMKAAEQARINLELSIFKTNKMDLIQQELDVIKEQKLRELQVDLDRQREKLQANMEKDILQLRQASEKQLLEEIDARKVVETQNMLAAVAEQGKIEQDKIKAEWERLDRESRAKIQQSLQAEKEAGQRDINAALAVMKREGEKRIHEELSLMRTQLEKELNDLYRSKEIEINDAYGAALAKQDGIVKVFAQNMEAGYQSGLAAYSEWKSKRRNITLVMKIVLSLVVVYFFVRLIWMFVIIRRKALSMRHAHRYIAILIGCLICSCLYHCLLYSQRRQTVQQLRSFVHATTKQLEEIFLKTYIFSFQKELSMRTDVLKAVLRLNLNWRMFQEQQVLVDGNQRLLSYYQIPMDISTRFSSLSEGLVRDWTDVQKKVRTVLDDITLGMPARSFDEDFENIYDQLDRMSFFLQLEDQRFNKFFYAHLSGIFVAFLVYALFVRQLFLKQIFCLLRDIKASMKANREGVFTEVLYPEEYHFIEIRRTAHNYNLLVRKMAKLLRDLKNGMTELLDLNQTAVDTSHSIVKDVERKIQVLEELEQSIQMTTETVASADTLSKETQKNALQAGEALNGAMEAMAAMEMTTRRLSEVVNLICDMTEQTNLLAMNASVEAAKVGEHSKEFSAVVDGVYRLTEKSANSAHEMQVMIRENLQEVGQSVLRSQDTDKEVKGVISRAQQVSDQIAEISTQAQEQSRILDHNVVRQTNRSTSLAAKLMQITNELEGLSDSLLETMNGLKLSKRKRK
jgi:methyl-accepting chemotaxis protein